MIIEDKDFIGREFPQNCGDSLFIIRKTNKKVSKNGRFIYIAKFLKYPYRTFIENKNTILKGQILNPRIEEEEFIKKIWHQNCGDDLKIINKTSLKKYQKNYLWKCRSLKTNKLIYALKNTIILGQVTNKYFDEILGKIYSQNCGDFLKVLSVSHFKNRKKIFKCEFQKYKYICYASKDQIKLGRIINPITDWSCEENLKNFIKNNFNYKPKLVELANKLGLSRQATGQALIKFNLENYIDYFPEGSNQENELREYITTLNKNTLLKSTWNILENKEIDIYIPNLKLGFEYNGNYWHSSLYKENSYHKEKSLLAQEKGINLVHIFEYEWLNKQNILKFFVKSKLGIFDKKIFARKCKIKELDYRTYADFCNKNHLQGEAGARVKLGLFYKEELIQIMSFGSPRFTDKFNWEIIRECSKLGYIIVGGKEKLWSYFIKKYSPKNCISYCDFSKFTGDSYLKLGFKKERLNKPGFVWYDEKTKEVFWRDPFNNEKMKNKGYLKIYDCGQLVFTWYKNDN